MPAFYRLFSTTLVNLEDVAMVRAVFVTGMNSWAIEVRLRSSPAPIYVQGDTDQEKTRSEVHAVIAAMENYVTSRVHTRRAGQNCS